MLLQLYYMLRYQFYDSTKDLVDLEGDIQFIKDFLDLEKMRRDDFDYTIVFNDNIDGIKIPPLLFITFVENAVKHSLDTEVKSYVDIVFARENEELLFTCINSKPRYSRKYEAGGLGLKNIKRRLHLLYGDRYKLDIEDSETSYSVKLRLKL